MNFTELPKSREIKTNNGTYLEVTRNLSDGNNGEVGKYIRDNWRYLTRRNITGISGLEGVYKNNMLFLDIETSGLSGESPIFMVALSHLAAESRKNIETRILVARDPLEEIPMLQSVLREIREHKSNSGYALVTYNGRSFDIPRIAQRLEINGLLYKGIPNAKTHLSEGHIDLIQAVRPLVGKLGVPDAGLKTLEKLVFGHKRSKDISGEKIPRTIYEYIYGETIGKIEYEKGKKKVIEKPRKLTLEESELAYEKIKRIIDHNETDNLTMVATMIKLCQM